MVKIFANSGALDQISLSVMSDLGLHCWPIGGLQINWVKEEYCRIIQGDASNESHKICFLSHLLVAWCDIGV